MGARVTSIALCFVNSHGGHASLGSLSVVFCTLMLCMLEGFLCFQLVRSMSHENSCPTLPCPVRSMSSRFGQLARRSIPRCLACAARFVFLLSMINVNSLLLQRLMSSPFSARRLNVHSFFVVIEPNAQSLFASCAQGQDPGSIANLISSRL